MTWGHVIYEADARIAFEKLRSVLEKAKTPISVVVDIRANPRFPMKLILTEGRGPYTHPMLGEWLIIGTSLIAHSIESTMSRFYGRRNVHWFRTEEEVMTYLESKVELA